MEISSTFKTTIDEACEVANWLTQEIYNWRNLNSDHFHQIKNKLQVLQPIADKYDRSFRTSHIVLEKDLELKLENASSSLWNSIAITLKTEQHVAPKSKSKDQTFDPKNIYLLCCCKKFSTVLFSIYDALVNTKETQIRNLKCRVNLLKTITDCFTQNYLANCSTKEGEIDQIKEERYEQSEIKTLWKTMLTNCQDYCEQSIRTIEEIKDQLDKYQVNDIDNLKLEFFIVNFQIYLKDGDLETAKLYSSKIDISNNLEIIDANSLIELCRVIFNSVLIYSKNCNTPDGNLECINLLKLALTYLELPVERLTSHINFKNMKYSIALFLTNLCVENCPELISTEECELLLIDLQETFGKKLDPYKMAIKFNCQEREIQNRNEIVQEIIMRMITNLDLIENWEKILECIGELAKINTLLAISSLEYIFINKLNPQNNKKTWEDLIVARVFLTIDSKHLTLDEIFVSLKDFFDLVETKLIEKLSTIKISAIVTLLWNTAKKLDKKRDFNRSSQFYELSLRNLFCKEFKETGKLVRALMSAYSNCNQFEKALQRIDMLDEREILHPLTQFILIKIYVNFDNKEKIMECFENIKTTEEANSIETLILAIQFCKKYDDVVIKGINILFDKIDKIDKFGKDNLVHKEENWSIPILELCRYTIQLIVKLLETDSSNMNKYFDTIETLLRKAKQIIENVRYKQNNNSSNEENLIEMDEFLCVNEIEWFASMAYNISVKGFNNKNISRDMSLVVEIAAEFISLLPFDQFTFPQHFYFKYWEYKVSIIKIQILLEGIKSYGNNNDNDDECKIEELILFLDKNLNDIYEFKNNNSNQRQMDEQNKADLESCLLDFVALQFQTLVSLGNHDQLQSFVEKTLSSSEYKVENILIELCSDNRNCPQGVIKKVFHTVIKKQLGGNQVSNSQFCIWIRLLLENLSRPGDVTDENIISNVLKKLQLEIMNDLSSLKDCKDDIEVISTLIWNVGVNHMIENNNNGAITWCQCSMLFAKLVNENLKEQLKKMWYSLIADSDIKDTDIDDI